MKIVVTAGGGGHFASALAVITAMPKTWDMLLIGRKYAFEADETISFEYKTAESLGIAFRSVTTARLQRKFTRYTIPSFFKLPLGFFQARAILKEYKPDLVLSFGGYVSLPVVVAAAMLRIPIVLHEQTLKAGLSNSIAARFAKAICLSWESSKAFFPTKKTILTGNPLKLDIMDIGDFFKDHTVERLPLLYITGGSLGSHPINMLILDCIEKLLAKYVVIHQTGDAQEYKDFDRLLEKKETLSQILQNRYIITKFVEPNMIGSVFRKATLVVARSGINTVSELLYFGKPALLIPLQFSQGKEQLENAQFFKKQGLGEVFLQDDLNAEKLYEHIVSMVTHKDRYEKHAKSAKTLLSLDASKNIIAVIEKSIYD